jgi:hypothetical protein
MLVAASVWLENVLKLLCAVVTFFGLYVCSFACCDKLCQASNNAMSVCTVILEFRSIRRR